MYLPVLGSEYVCLIQVACLIEVAIKTGFTVLSPVMVSVLFFLILS